MRFLLLAGLFVSSVLADTKAILDDIFAVRHFRDVAISPDGRSAAWVESSGGKDPDKAKLSAMYVKDLGSDGAPRRITASRCEEHSPAWSRDGKLAFLSDVAGKGQLQLWVMAKGSPPRKLTAVKGFLSDPHWSPDGRSIAVLFTENAVRMAGPLEATTPGQGVIDEEVHEQRLAIVDAATGKVRSVSPAKLYVYEYDWAPAGDQIAYTAAPGPGDDNWYIAQLYKMDLSSGVATVLYQPAKDMQIANPRWSPDGKSVAYIGGIMSDEGSTGGEIYVVPSAGGQPKDVTPGRKSTPSWFQWLPSSQRILFAEHVAGQSAFATLDLSSGQTERLWMGSESIEAAFTPDGTVSAVVRSSWNLAPEVWAGAPGKWARLTSANRALHPKWGEAKSIEWQSDSFRVQGWLLLPVNYDASRKYPMIVNPHGGPAAEAMPRWPSPFFDLSIMSSEGYFVFFPNPRGSYGQGEEFTKANVKDFGYGDLRDILSGVDKILKQYPVDPKRLGIGGWSYGGYMTMWAVTQTDRFHAAVSGAGLSNWQSYYGENSIDQWMIPYFGASVYDDPQVYAKSSPITFIKQVKTPTLVVVGERDGECPAPQSYEFWHALKTLGVKTQMVVYPNEGHRFRNPEHIADLLKRTIEWFQVNLP